MTDKTEVKEPSTKENVLLYYKCDDCGYKTPIKEKFDSHNEEKHDGKAGFSKVPFAEEEDLETLRREEEAEKQKRYLDSLMRYLREKGIGCGICSMKKDFVYGEDIIIESPTKTYVLSVKKIEERE
jgi:hypothetical protein